MRQFTTVPAVYLSWTKEKDTKTKRATQGGKIQMKFVKNTESTVLVPTSLYLAEAPSLLVPSG